MGKLADGTIRTAKAKDKDYVLTDGSGLQINIRSNNTKRWELIYKSPTTFKRRKYLLGTYPTIPFIEARELSANNLLIIKQGIDPIDQKREDELKSNQNDNSNFKQIADEWLEYEAKRTTPETHRRKKAILVNDSYAFFENKSINDINHQDLIIPKAQTLHNPKLTDNNEVAKLVSDIYNYKGHYSTVSALKFALHISLRAETLCNLKWEYIDLDNRSLTIPRELMKIKDINLPDFKVPLSDEVIEILEEQKELTRHSTYVFLSNMNKAINPNTPNEALKRMGYQDKQTLHGLRGIYRSLAETHQREHNTSEEAKEVFLDHYEGSTTQKAYKHKAYYFDQMKPLVEWWSKYISSMKG